MRGADTITGSEFPRIQCRDLSVGYLRKHPVMVDLNAVWEQPGIHLIIGRNGAGKSTLIRTLAGLQKPLSGHVIWGEMQAAQLQARERARWMAFVESTPPRSSEMSVCEALKLVTDDFEQIRHWLERFGSVDWWNTPLETLSDGQLQKVMLVRAILQNTPWILMDEPTAFLDVPSRMEMWMILEELVDEGKRIMLTSHDFHLISNQSKLKSVVAAKDGILIPLDPAEGANSWLLQI